MENHCSSNDGGQIFYNKNKKLYTIIIACICSSKNCCISIVRIGIESHYKILRKPLRFEMYFLAFLLPNIVQLRKFKVPIHTSAVDVKMQRHRDTTPRQQAYTTVYGYIYSAQFSRQLYNFQKARNTHNIIYSSLISV